MLTTTLQGVLSTFLRAKSVFNSPLCLKITVFKEYLIWFVKEKVKITFFYYKQRNRHINAPLYRVIKHYFRLELYWWTFTQTNISLSNKYNKGQTSDKPGQNYYKLPLVKQMKPSNCSLIKKRSKSCKELNFCQYIYVHTFK